MCRKITSHWQPLFSKKMVAVASFSYKIGSGGLIFLQNWRWRQGFGNITGGCSDMVWILALRHIGPGSALRAFCILELVPIEVDASATRFKNPTSLLLLIIADHFLAHYYPMLQKASEKGCSLTFPNQSETLSSANCKQT